MPKSIEVVKDFEAEDRPKRLRLYVKGGLIRVETEDGKENTLAELTEDGRLALWALTDEFAEVLDCDKNSRIKIRREA